MSIVVFEMKKKLTIKKMFKIDDTRRKISNDDHSKKFKIQNVIRRRQTTYSIKIKIGKK